MLCSLAKKFSQIVFVHPDLMFALGIGAGLDVLSEAPQRVDTLRVQVTLERMVRLAGQDRDPRLNRGGGLRSTVDVDLQPLARPIR